ncbi:GNAT family N-acetyltransferase [Myxosarcina sp. GI1(2024)]
MGKRASGRNWRKGVSIAFDKLNYQSLVCEALVVNRRSERVMQKLGFLFEGNIIKGDRPHVLYRYKHPQLSVRARQCFASGSPYEG